MNFLASLFAPIKHPYCESVASDDHDNGIPLALPPTITLHGAQEAFQDYKTTSIWN